VPHVAGEGADGLHYNEPASGIRHGNDPHS